MATLVSRHFPTFLLISMLVLRPAIAQVQNTLTPCSNGTLNLLKSPLLNEELGEFCKMKGGGMDGRRMNDENGKMDCLYCCADHYWGVESKSCMKCPKGTYSNPGPSTHCIPIDGDESADSHSHITTLSTPTTRGITPEINSQNVQSMNSIPSEYEVMPTTQPKDLDSETVVTVTSQHPDEQGTSPDPLDRDQYSGTSTLPIILGVIGVLVSVLLSALIVYFKRKSTSSSQGYQPGRHEQGGGDHGSSTDSPETSVESVLIET